MGKADARGRSKTKFIMLTHSMMDSEAFKALSTVDVCVLLQIFRRHNGYNNSEISLSCREVASSLRISKDTANRSFHSLSEKGFIKPTRKGGLNIKERHATRWELTNNPRAIGIAPTNEWRYWKPENLKDGTISGTDVPIEGTDV